tara:strand:- start:1790 stop:2188 length:399 start_codon:yes stop_codon:yes gene_type:complete
MSVENNTRWPKPSINHVPEYQLSGLPYAKKITLADGANDTLVLPRVSRWIMISCSSDIEIAFSSGGISGGTGETEHFLLNNGSTGRLELRCTEITFKDVEDGSIVYVMAGLTNIKSEDSYTQTDLSWITKQA